MTGRNKMRKIKQSSILITMLLILSLMIGACGKKSEESGTPASAETSSAAESAQESVTIITSAPKAPEEAQEEASSEESAGSEAESAALPGQNTGSEEAGIPAAQEKAGNSALNVMTGSGTITGEDDSSYEMMYQITYPWLSLAEDDKESHPELQSALEAKSREFEENARKSEDWYRDAAKESKEIDPEYFTMLYSGELLSVVRADEQALSVVGSYSNYGGGAHGMYGFNGYSFDPKTGREIGIRDVVNDIPALLKMISEKVQEDYPGLSMMSAEYTLTEENADNLQFAIGYESLIFYFEPYALASYAEGSQVVSIPFKGNEGLINGKYFDVPDHYGVEFAGGTAYEDTNGDGIPEAISVTVSANNEEGVIQQIGINIAGRTFMEEEEEFLGYSYLPTLVRVGQKLYLYVELSSDNDYKFFRIYNVTGGQFSQCDENWYSFAREWSGNYEMQSRTTLSDPTLVKMWMNTDVLGTGKAYSWFYVGDDGRLVNFNEGYFLEHYGEEALTLKQDLAVIAVEPNNKYGKGTEVTLKAGTRVTGYYTDNETYVEIKDPDGDNYWVGGQFAEWPLTVGGIPMDDLFDGIMYAG